MALQHVPKKTLAIMAIALLFPLYLLYRGAYDADFGFYSTGFSPEVWGQTRILASLLIAMSLLGAFVGLISPSLVVWSGERTRVNVLVIFGVVAFVGLFMMFVEAPTLTRMQFKNEESVLDAIYDEIDTSMSISDIHQLANGRNRYIRTWPYKDENALHIGFPSSFSILIARRSGIKLQPLEFDSVAPTERKITRIQGGATSLNR